MSKEFVKKQVVELRDTIRVKVSGYILTGFGVVAGLAWNDAIKALIEHLFPKDDGGGLVAQFVYAVIVTVFVVIIMFLVTKLLKSEQTKKEKSG